MFELYLGLVPGEAPIDQLIDGAIADPALARAQPVETVVVGAPAALVARAPANGNVADESGLWRHMLTRWIDTAA